MINSHKFLGWSLIETIYRPVANRLVVVVVKYTKLGRQPEVEAIFVRFFAIIQRVPTASIPIYRGLRIR